MTYLLGEAQQAKIWLYTSSPTAAKWQPGEQEHNRRITETLCNMHKMANITCCFIHTYILFLICEYVCVNVLVYVSFYYTLALTYHANETIWKHVEVMRMEQHICYLLFLS